MGVLNSSRKAMKGFIEKSYSMGQLHGEMKKTMILGDRT